MRHCLLLTVVELGSLLVMLALAGPAAAAEEAICSDPNVFFCENWEDRATGSGDLTTAKSAKTLGWGVSDTGTQSVVTVNAVDGTKSIQHFYPATPRPGDNGGGGFIGTPFLPANRTVYFRLWVKYSSNFQRSSNGEKIFYYEGSPGNVRLEMALLWGDDVPALNYGYGPNLFPNMNTNSAHLGVNQWKCLETRVTLEAPSGANNGYYQAWVDDVQVAEYPNIGSLQDPSFGPISSKFADYLLSAYWNCVQGTEVDCKVAHPDMYRWMDKVIISTARIGCGTAPGSGATPSAPGQTQVK